MSITLLRPYALLLVPFSLIFILFTSKYMNRMFWWKKNSILILRNIVLLFLILAFAGVSLNWRANTIATIFLIDSSDSTLFSKNEMEKFVRDASALKNSKDKLGIITFGDNALVESFISKEAVFNKVETKVNGTYTNMENALTAAISLMPQNSKKRIVLISDGEENQGKSFKMVPSLLEQGIDIKVHKIEKKTGAEVAVDSIACPQKLVLGEQFSVVVTISSTANTSCKLTLFSGREKTAEQKVELYKGINKFAFKDAAESGGFRVYKVLIEPDIDTEIKNNEACTFTNVADKPRILVIEDSKGEADEIVKILKASKMDFVKVNAISAPRTLQELSAYKTIISCNVSAENFNEGFLNSLEAYVKDFGGGFIATGGENSYALGGYFKTPLEKVLPVNMDMKGKKEIPDMAMMLIIDKSGSMSEGSGGITKVDIAKEAASRTVDSLRDRDEIGVLAFDGAYSWVVKRQQLKDRKAVKNDIGTIRADGGTSILPALEEGYKSLKSSKAKIKHIILLTDGQAENSGYSELIDEIKKDNITISTVAVGKDADRGLLESVAKDGSGRFYYTDEFTNIPRIFAKETYMAAGAYLNNREFTPIINSNHPILSRVAENGMPSLLGYIGASAKDTAKVILKSDEDDPILTVWQYGLGKTAAWNSDITGKWSGNFISWNKNINLWQNLINFTVENYDNENIALEVNNEGGKGAVTLTDRNYKEEFDSRAVVVTPSLENKEIKLYPIAPGKYSGNFDVKEPGIYMIKGKQLKGGETVNAVSAGLAMQYSPEYKISGENTVLETLVKETGGAFIKTPEEAFKGKIKDVSGKTDLTSFFLMLALILLMVDIALRRLNISLYKITHWLKSLIPEKKIKVKKKKVKKKAIVEEVREEAQEKNSLGNTIQDMPKEKEQQLDTSKLLKKKNNRYR